MNDFVEEYKHLHQVGLNYKHAVVPLSVHAFACDAVAQGWQTRFSSGANSGKFNLKRAGPM